MPASKSPTIPRACEPVRFGTVLALFRAIRTLGWLHRVKCEVFFALSLPQIVTATQAAVFAAFFQLDTRAIFASIFPPNRRVPNARLIARTARIPASVRPPPLLRAQAPAHARRATRTCAARIHARTHIRAPRATRAMHASPEPRISNHSARFETPTRARDSRAKARDSGVTARVILARA